MKKALLAAFVYAKKDFCTEKGVSWTRFNGKAQNIAANSKNSDVWVISNFKHKDGGFNLARLDFRRNRMSIEKEAEHGAKPWMGSPLAVDYRGNPAYVDAEKHLHWKRRGKWGKYMSDPKCAFTLAFGGDGSFFARDCKFSYAHKMQRDGKWFVFPRNRELDFNGLYDRKKEVIASTKGL